MGRLKEVILNGLLILLVLLSVGLSAQVWFPTNEIRPSGAREPRVQSTPARTEGRLPDIFRPERIYFRAPQEQVALVQAGSPSYDAVWRPIGDLLTGLRSTAGLALSQEVIVDPSPSITLVLPLPLALSEWADHWGWLTAGLSQPRLKVDQVTFHMGETTGIYVSGPTGESYRLGPLTVAEQKVLQGAFDSLDPLQFRPYRSLVFEQELPSRVTGLLVPAVEAVPLAFIEEPEPIDKAETAFYFPDLSVVRQIDERETQSYTDGQRLMRLSSSGILEYRSANPSGSAPNLMRSLKAAAQWVEERGGWPQSVILTDFRYQSGTTHLTFEQRLNGPYPVETSAGAIRMEVTTDQADLTSDRIIYLQRHPQINSSFEDRMVAIISAEEALETVAKEQPRILLFGIVRDVYLAYRVEPVTNQWMIDPVWVLQIGDERIYVPAGA